MIALRQVLLTAAGVLLAVSILDLIRWVDAPRPSLTMIGFILVLASAGAIVGTIQEYLKR